MFSSHGSSKWRGKVESVLDNSVQAKSLYDANEIVRPRLEITEGLSAQEVVSRGQRGVDHLIQIDSLEFESEQRASLLMMNSPGSFFKDPIGTIFSEPASGLLIFHATFDAHEKKHRLLKNLNDFIPGLPNSRGILLPANSIADELYTNGSKNAWDREQTPYVDEPRREGKIDFFAAASETRLVLGCRDSFGLLQIESLLYRISTCLQNGIADSILKNTWGAGIGAFYIFDAAQSLYIGVNPGVETVVCASLALGRRQKDADDITKNLHLIRIGGR